MRMGVRRFTRLTKAFSRSVENHAPSVALYFMYYSSVRVHQTLRVTPAMEAGVSSHVWSIAEIVTLIDAVEKKTRVGTCLGDSSGGKDGNRDQLHRAISLDDPEAPELYRFDERVESRVWWEPSRPASTVGGETCRSCNVVCLLVRGYFFWTVRILTLTTTGCSMQLTKRRHE